MDVKGIIPNSKEDAFLVAGPGLLVVSPDGSFFMEMAGVCF
jgi:hypothetical protein